MASIWMLFFAILASLEISVASEDCAAKAKVLNRQEEKACHKWVLKPFSTNPLD